MSTEIAESLTIDEILAFKERGYLGPYPMMSPEEMGALTSGIEDVLESDPFVDTGSNNTPEGTSARKYNREHNRHLDKRLIHDLATHPAATEIAY